MMSTCSSIVMDVEARHHRLEVAVGWQLQPGGTCTDIFLRKAINRPLLFLRFLPPLSYRLHGYHSSHMADTCHGPLWCYCLDKKNPRLERPNFSGMSVRGVSPASHVTEASSRMKRQSQLSFQSNASCGSDQ